MNDLAPRVTVVGRLRIKGAALDPLAARVRAESLLAITDLRPAGLGPAAVLCIRRLPDPLPGRIDLRQSGPASMPWQAALAAALARLAAVAARPALGLVPASAEAVVFADRAELLACLAADWCTGDVIGSWWWRELLRGRDIGEAVRAAWLETPNHAPAALALLAGRGLAVAFGLRLGAPAARALTVAVLTRYGLPELAAAVAILASGSQMETPPALPAGEKRTAPDAHAAPWQPWAGESRASGLSPAATCLLGLGLALARAPSAVRTAAFSRDLRAWAASTQAPAAPRDPEAYSAEPTMRPPTGSAHSALPGAGATPLPEAAGAQPDPAPASDLQVPAGLSWTDPHVQPSPPDAGMAGGEMPDRPAAGSAGWPGEPRGRAAGPRLAIGQVEPARAPARAATRDAAPSPAEAAGASGLPDPGPGGPVTGGMPPETALEPTASQALVPAPPLISGAAHLPSLDDGSMPAVVETGLGGLFYLLNLGLFLELYGDFTTPARPGIALSIWDFVALVGAGLLVTDSQRPPVDDARIWSHRENNKIVGHASGVTRYRPHAMPRGRPDLPDALSHTDQTAPPPGFAGASDPVWLLLARLAGRTPGQLAGHDFRAPVAWRLPPAWLAPLAEPGRPQTAWRWQALRGRLQLAHPAGFLVLDLPLGPRATPAAILRRLGRELRPYGRPRLARASARLGLQATFGSDRLARWLAWLLPYVRARLHLALGAAFESGAWYRQPARVHVTAAHVDVVLALAGLPIAVRLAGLDRDPGWVPAAGRFIRFHYD